MADDVDLFEPDPLARPVFVVGMGRSGTTMMRLMLDRHPALAVLSETSFGARVWERRWGFRLVAQDRDLREEFLDGWIDSLQCADMENQGTDWNAYRTKVLAREPSLSCFLSVLGEMRAEQTGKVRWGEKTPTHVYYLRTLDRMWPGMLAVNLVRDPRAVAASWMSAGFSRTADPLAVALEWRRNVRLAEEAALQGVSVLTVRYEDLVENPGSTLAQVCAHTGLGFTDDLINFHESASKAAPPHAWLQKLSSPLHATPSNTWRGRLSEEDVLYVEVLTHSLMEQYSYAPISPQRSLQEMVRHATRIESAHSGSLAADMRPIADSVPVDEKTYAIVLGNLGGPKDRSRRAGVHKISS